MKLKPSYLVAAAVVIAFGLWFALGSASDDRDIYSDLEQRDTAATAALPTVIVRPVTAERHPIRLTQYGRTEPNRRVEVKAKTPGSLVATPVREGARVNRGDVICRQDTDARQAMVEQARAQLDKAEADLTATQALVERGFRAPTSLNGDRAAVDAARASLKQAQIELGNIVLRAPFSGIYEERLAEIGDYLSPGQPCAAIVELDPLVLEAELTETQVGQVEMGQEVQVRLATGQTVAGTVSFIESVANPATRTFQMETSLPNEDYALKAGVSATLSLKIGEAMASLVPSGIMALDDDGNVGVRYLDASDRVRFANIRQIDETREGLWVSGLPERTRIIIEGQDYVSVGTEVDARLESDVRDGAAVAGLSTPPRLD
ncbi:efflux RND transporter periplasmic adaptor subunit [uncultured Algimonas sp.]|uniref:efflux RND transporter periplasmic adaptor subunit n=1 Tax=uncultured Algimonas sp. TaxID=1547920 RepID=UPI0026252276|nr:efflux RND transporter periplasmic adaptor subunit [uncultured Algimonas sp.]